MERIDFQKMSRKVTIEMLSEIRLHFSWIVEKIVKNKVHFEKKKPREAEDEKQEEEANEEKKESASETSDSSPEMKGNKEIRKEAAKGAESPASLGKKEKVATAITLNTRNS